MARKMRDSGVEWIGEVPEGWEIARLKSLFSYGKGLAITKADLTPKGIPVISYGQIHSKANSGTHLQDGLLRCVSAEYLQTDGDCLLKKNDFVFADTSEDLEGLGNCAFVDRDDKIFAGYHTIVFHPKCDMPSKYLAYLFKTDCWRSQFRAKAYGIKVYSLSQRLLNDCSVVLPQEQEAERIADYLDEKCAAIDGSVDELKRGIEDCKAWKKAIIFEAVTGKKRVTGNGERGMGRMRDSGIPWIGEIPEGWEVRRLKDVANIQTGSTPDKKYQNEFYSSESGVPWIKAENLGRMSPILTTAEYLTPAGEIQGRVFPEKSVYVCCIASIGKVGYSEIRASCNQQINALVFKKPVYWKFGFYVTTASEEEYLIKASGNVVKILNSTEQGLIGFPLPPLHEQQAIADYLEEKCAAIDALVTEKEKLIADLEAYKKSLIFELVTGKREVA